MIEVLLAPFGFYGGDFGSILSQLEQMGFFAYVLPFLVVFAIVFGVLSNAKFLGDNKAINAVIAISVGLMALQFGVVTQFFGEIFPRLGIWLSIILAGLIVIGFFSPSGKLPFGFMMIVAGGIIAVIVAGSFNEPFFDYGFPFWLTQNLGWIIPVAVILAVIGWAWSSQAPKTTTGVDLVRKIFEPGK